MYSLTSLHYKYKKENENFIVLFAQKNRIKNVKIAQKKQKDVAELWNLFRSNNENRRD